MRARMHASLLVYARVRACVPACVCRELCVRARQHWLCVCEAERVLVRISQHRACARARAHLQTLHARALTHPHARSRPLTHTRTHGHTDTRTPQVFAIKVVEKALVLKEGKQK